MAWTDEMVEDLKTMWKQGLTTAEIGKRLGVSKNSIVGKVHRLGLSGRPSPIKKKETPATAPSTPEVKKSTKEKVTKVEKTEKIEPVKEEIKVQPKEEIKVEKTISEPVCPIEKAEPKISECQKSDFDKSARAVSLVELDNHTCRWPIGDPKDENFHFCGRKVRIGQTYCDEHSQVAYVKTGKTK